MTPRGFYLSHPTFNLGPFHFTFSLSLSPSHSHLVLCVAGAKKEARDYLRAMLTLHYHIALQCLPCRLLRYRGTIRLDGVAANPDESGECEGICAQSREGVCGFCARESDTAFLLCELHQLSQGLERREKGTGGFERCKERKIVLYDMLGKLRQHCGRAQGGFCIRDAKSAVWYLE